MPSLPVDSTPPLLTTLPPPMPPSVVRQLSFHSALGPPGAHPDLGPTTLDFSNVAVAPATSVAAPPPVPLPPASLPVEPASVPLSALPSPFAPHAPLPSVPEAPRDPPVPSIPSSSIPVPSVSILVDDETSEDASPPRRLPPSPKCSASKKFHPASCEAPPSAPPPPAGTQDPVPIPPSLPSSEPTSEVLPPESQPVPVCKPIAALAEETRDQVAAFARRQGVSLTQAQKGALSRQVVCEVALRKMREHRAPTNAIAAAMAQQRAVLEKSLRQSARILRAEVAYDARRTEKAQAKLLGILKRRAILAAALKSPTGVPPTNHVPPP